MLNRKHALFPDLIQEAKNHFATANVKSARIKLGVRRAHATKVEIRRSAVNITFIILSRFRANTLAAGFSFPAIISRYISQRDKRNQSATERQPSLS
jgi:hypothetical protein